MISCTFIPVWSISFWEVKADYLLAIPDIREPIVRVALIVD